METDFWLRRWRNNEIGFHQREVNPLLVAHFDDVCLQRGARVFVPLCGKTLDIPWLLSRGYRVAGVELSELAVEQLFEGLGVKPRVSDIGALKQYSAADIDIFVGDIFELSADALGPVDATYDRAALVALPEDMRGHYARHVIEITDRAPQFLLTFEYDQSEMDGPPFSVTGAEVSLLYKDTYDVTLATSKDIPGGLKGKCAATENAWLLTDS
ncbi:MAG: thiopurine S-methyltransferase [Gammaproteobacteria bacterium]|nr:thiopurine S-methyltransferase [Gammaproteobacteria bacterium]